MNESNLDAHVSIVARVGGGRTEGEMMDRGDHGSDCIALSSYIAREVEEGSTTTERFTIELIVFSSEELGAFEDTQILLLSASESWNSHQSVTSHGRRRKISLSRTDHRNIVQDDDTFKELKHQE